MPGRVSTLDLGALIGGRRAAVSRRLLLQDVYPAARLVALFVGAGVAAYGRARACAGIARSVALRQAPHALRRAGGRRRTGRACRQRSPPGIAARASSSPTATRCLAARCCVAPTASARRTAPPGPPRRSPNWRRCRRSGCCPRTTVLGRYDDNYLVAAERVGDLLGPAAPAGLPRLRLWHIRARQVVLATGALERPLVFPGNDRPGIMLASAVESYIRRYAVVPGRRAVLFANNDDAYRTAATLTEAGADDCGDRRSARQAGPRGTADRACDPALHRLHGRRDRRA